MPPSRDKPRDAEGWEKLGLFEFYKLKEKYKERGLRRPGERGESRYSEVDFLLNGGYHSKT